MNASKLLLLSNLEYYLKIKQLFGSSIIAHWPLWEAGGSVAYDISGNGRNGAAAGIDWGYPGIGDGHTSAYFDGANDYVNVYSASLAAAFNGAEGTIIMWLKVHDVGVWTDGLRHFAVRLEADGNNNVSIMKTTTNQLYWYYVAGGVSLRPELIVTPTNFICTGLTWSKDNDRVKAFYNGPQADVTKTGLGVWAGVLDATRTVIGALNTASVYSWYGYLAHGVLLNREATHAEMLMAAQV